MVRIRLRTVRGKDFGGPARLVYVGFLEALAERVTRGKQILRLDCKAGDIAGDGHLLRLPVDHQVQDGHRQWRGGEGGRNQGGARRRHPHDRHGRGLQLRAFGRQGDRRIPEGGPVHRHQGDVPPPAARRARKITRKEPQEAEPELRRPLPGPPAKPLRAHQGDHVSDGGDGRQRPRQVHRRLQLLAQADGRGERRPEEVPPRVDPDALPSRRQADGEGDTALLQEGEHGAPRVLPAGPREAHLQQGVGETSGRSTARPLPRWRSTGCSPRRTCFPFQGPRTVCTSRTTSGQSAGGCRRKTEPSWRGPTLPRPDPPSRILT